MRGDGASDGAGTSAWVVARGIVGWIPDDAAETLQHLDAHVQALRSRQAALEREVEAARQAGFAAGMAEAAAAVDAMSAHLEGAREVAVERAAAAALVVAQELAGAAIAADPSAVAEQIRERIGREGERPDRVRVAPDLAAFVGRLLGAEVPVVGDPSMNVGDAVIEWPRGKVEQSLAAVLAHWASAVRAMVGNDDG